MTRILRRYSVFWGLAAALLCGWGFQSLEAAETQQLRIITTNDLHSYLKPLYWRWWIVSPACSLILQSNLQT